MARTSGPLVICIINLKGGVGKSTISALLSRHAFQYRNCDVLAIDIDPQANLSQGLMHSAYEKHLRAKKPTIVELFQGYIPPSASKPSPTSWTVSDLVVNLATIGNRSLELIPSRFDFADNLVSAVRPNPHTLAKFLSTEFQHKDLIIIDCAPTDSILTQAAYHASAFVLIPVKPEYFATVGFPLLQESLEKFRMSNKSSSIDVAGVVVNNAFYDGGNDGGPEKKASIKQIKAVALANGWHVFATQIPFSRGFPKIMRGVFTYSGNAAKFPNFAREFFRHIGL